MVKDKPVKVKLRKPSYRYYLKQRLGKEKMKEVFISLENGISYIMANKSIIENENIKDLLSAA